MLIILLLFTIFVQCNLAFSVIFIKTQMVVYDFLQTGFIFFSHFGYIHTDRSHYTRIQRTIFTNSEVSMKKQLLSMICPVSESVRSRQRFRYYPRWACSVVRLQQPY